MSAEVLAGGQPGEQRLAGRLDPSPPRPASPSKTVSRMSRSFTCSSPANSSLVRSWQYLRTSSSETSDPRLHLARHEQVVLEVPAQAARGRS